jgi:hypothetical protein
MGIKSSPKVSGGGKVKVREREGKCGKKTVKRERKERDIKLKEFVSIL